MYLDPAWSIGSRGTMGVEHRRFTRTADMTNDGAMLVYLPCRCCPSYPRGTAVEWPPFPPMAELTVAFYKVGHALRHDLQRTVHGAFLSHTKVAA